MDTVPTGAALLLAFIRETETGRADRSAYNTIYAHKEGKLPKPLTTMTLGDIIDAQRGWSKNFGSSAAGAYQCMRATLIDLSKTLNLSGNLIFNADLQDRLGYELLKRRGYEDYIGGKISPIEFGKRLAQEWASFPVLTACQGAHRAVQRGETYYAGDKLNKALVAPEKVEQILLAVRKAPDLAPAPVDANKTAGVPFPPRMPEPPPASSGKAKAAAAGVFVLIATALFAGWQHVIDAIHHLWSMF